MSSGRSRASGSAVSAGKGTGAAIMTLRQEGTDSTELQQQLRTIRALHRCWHWMWTPAPSPRCGGLDRHPALFPAQGRTERPLSMEQSLENRVVGQSPALCASHSGCGRLKPASRRRTAHRGIPADRPQRHRQNRNCAHTGDTLFGGEKSLITINLSEYQDRIPFPS